MDGFDNNDIICDKCQGTGKSFDCALAFVLCEKCNGEGKLNWVENIFGKNNSNRFLSIGLDKVQSLQIKTFYDKVKINE